MQCPESAQSFEELLQENWHVPKKPAAHIEVSLPQDSLALSIRAARALPPSAAQSANKAAPTAVERKDSQGNRARFSIGGQHLATINRDRIAWETPLHKCEEDAGSGVD